MTYNTPDRHVFGEGVRPEGPLSPVEIKRRKYFERRDALNAELKQRLADQAERHQAERDALSEEYNLKHRENAREAGFR